PRPNRVAMREQPVFYGDPDPREKPMAALDRDESGVGCAAAFGPASPPLDPALIPRAGPAGPCNVSRSAWIDRAGPPVAAAAAAAIGSRFSGRIRAAQR